MDQKLNTVAELMGRQIAATAENPAEVAGNVLVGAMLYDAQTKGHKPAEGAEFLASVIASILLDVDGLAIPFMIALNSKMDTN